MVSKGGTTTGSDDAASGCACGVSRNDTRLNVAGWSLLLASASFVRRRRRR